MVTTADVTDRNGAIDMVDYYCDVTNHLFTLKKILADGGYTGENFANSVKTLSGAAVEIVKRNELHTWHGVKSCVNDRGTVCKGCPCETGLRNRH